MIKPSLDTQELYPQYEMMPYDPNWEQIEKNWDLNQPKRIFVPSSTVKGISFADFLIIKNWFAYGQKNDDKTGGKQRIDCLEMKIETMPTSV